MHLVLYFFITLFITSVSSAQIFSRITTGPMVTDGGDSRAVNWIDYDNDGDLDLFVTNGPSPGQNNFFYENNGDETFTKINSLIINLDNSASDGSSWGDYNNDGHTDLFVANWYGQPNRLYKNNGDKTFTLISNTIISTEAGHSETGSWGDYNLDGFLDLFVCNSGGNLRNFLYKNNGDGTFSKITDTFLNQAFSSRNIDWVDYNNDNLPDIFVTNESNQNENLYLNNGDGTFNAANIPSLLQNGGSTAGSNWEDIDNDGDFDVLLVNWSNQRNHLLINNGDGTFTKSNEEPFTTDISNSFGSSIGDVDNDGDLDIFISNAFTSGRTKNYLYINNGDDTFVRDSGTVASDLGWTYGSAFGDFNKDGWLDLFLAKVFNANENNALYKNNGGTNNWIIINLEGKHSNRSAIGAEVKLKADIFGNSFWQTRKVTGQNGYCGQNLQLHFGLGDAAQIDSLIIKWPSGIIQKVESLNINDFHYIAEDTTLVSVGFEPEPYPSEYELFQNYPNPFNPTTIISFTLSNHEKVQIKIFNELGQEIRELAREEFSAGKHNLIWDGKNKFGEIVSSGTYFARITLAGKAKTIKLSLIK
jgi:hypothetical protein